MESGMLSSRVLQFSDLILKLKNPSVVMIELILGIDKVAFQLRDFILKLRNLEFLIMGLIFQDYYLRIVVVCADGKYSCDQHNYRHQNYQRPSFPHGSLQAASIPPVITIRPLACITARLREWRSTFQDSPMILILSLFA
jgi:hypothetical protein